MRNIEQVIKSYLSKPTQYAIQITGKWGVGKTYHFKNNLATLIESVPTYHNAKKKYKPLYISLFGLKSVDEIAAKMVFDFFGAKAFKEYLKKTESKKALRIRQGIPKTWIRSFLSFKCPGNADDYLTDVRQLGQKVPNTSELLICFDDVERKHPDLSFESLAGYISCLVDEGIKVLVISGEDLLSENDQYAILKEKMIGISVPYIPDVPKTVRNIVTAKYSRFSTYYDFLTNNIQLISDTAKAANSNFRRLIYALDVLFDVHSLIEKNIFDIRHEIASALRKELPYITRLTLAFSIEFKSSSLTNEKKGNYNQTALYFDEIFDIRQTSDEKEDIGLFLKKYGIEKRYYKFFESIFDFTTSHSEFIIEDFVAEFKEIYHLQNGSIPLHYQVFNELSYPECLDLSDVAYMQKTHEMIEYAKEGKYILNEYLVIMQYSERFNNMLGLDLESVKKDLIVGLRKAIRALTDKSALQFEQFKLSNGNAMSSYSRDLLNAGNESIEELKKTNEAALAKDCLHILLEDSLEFQHLLETDAQFRYHAFLYPILSEAEPEEFVERVKRKSNKELRFITLFFRERFADKENLKKEISHIMKIKDLLTVYRNDLLAEENANIRTFVVEDLLSTLSQMDNL